MANYHHDASKKAADVDQSSVYPSDRIAVVLTSLKASEFIASELPVEDVNITSLDVSSADFADAKNIPYVKALDLSRLGLTDEHIGEIFSRAKFESLVWLNLAGNRGITETGVRAICESVRSGLSGKLDWLCLLGTECDASPYVDGHYWRMSSHAKKLASEFGDQRWMMLGSRISSDECFELLTTEQRECELGRFTRLR
jgi:hypothetical protein